MILVEDLCKPVELRGNVVHVHQIRVGPNWMDFIILFLKEDVLPENKSEADKVRRKAYWFWLSEDQKLYKRSFFGPYLLCYTQKQLSYSWKNYMKEFVGATRGADLCLIGPLHKAIGGQICRKKHKTM